MPISKTEQIAQRRTRVWELYSRGMTQEEIADELEKVHGVSRRMIGYDLEILKKDSVTNFMKANRKNIAEEYRKVMSNLEQLRKEAWVQFSEIKNKDSNAKVALYDTIQSINNNILVMLSVGDIIEMEMKVKAANENVKEIRQEMNKALEQRIKRQAIF